MLNIDVLVKIGLKEKQAQVYLACLKLGASKVGAIQKESGIKRTTLYDILEELEELGLVSYTIKQKTRIYNPENPEQLKGLVEERVKNIQTILPDLQKLFFSVDYRPTMRFFAGVEGIKQIYKDSLACQEKKILQIVSVRDFQEFPGKKFMAWYVEERAKKGIKAIAIHPKSGDVYDGNFGENSQLLKREVKYLPPALFSMSMIMIYDNNVVAMSTKKENYGFIVESREYSQAMRMMFDFLWKLGSGEHE